MPATTTENDRDWRSWAYLKAIRWPEAIPEMGPKREYGPRPWSEKAHHDPLDLDDYPHSHPGAGSVGETYMGDVCPYCGVPLDWVNDEVVMWDGRRGPFHEVNEIDTPKPAYHPECWRERQAETHGQTNATFDEFEGGGE